MLVLVDGLNTYHALKSQDSGNSKLNLMSICKALALNNGCDSIEILYFTALVEHLDTKTREWQFDYLSRLRGTGIQIFESEFRSQLEECNICGNRNRRYVEKQTDVSISINLISKVLEEDLAEVLLFSADSDFIPALNMVRQKRPNVGLKVVSTPSYLRPVHGELRKANIGTIRLSPELVAKHQFN